MAATSASATIVAICLRIVAVLVLRFLFSLFSWNPVQLQRMRCNDLKIRAAFRAGDDFALINLIFCDVQVSLALRAKNHASSDHLRPSCSAEPCLLYLEAL